MDTHDYGPSVVTTNCLEDPISRFAFAGAWMLAAMVALSVMIFVLLMLSRGDGRAARPALGEVQPLSGAPPTVRVNINALDGLRTVLIAFTIIHNRYDELSGTVSPVFLTGMWQVTFFFVLSGFVMQYGVEGRREPFKFASGAGFIAKRLVRICPVYWLALLLCFFFSGIGYAKDKPYIAWPLQASLLQALVPMKTCGPAEFPWMNYVHFTGNVPGWFASVIVFLSVLSPMLSNLGSTGRWWATLSVMVILCALRSIPTFFHTHFPAHGEGIDLYAFAPLRIFEFEAGILAACLCKELPETWRRWPVWGLVGDVCLLFGLLQVYLFRVTPLAIGIRGDRGHAAHGDYCHTLTFCFVCIGYRLGMENKKADGWLYAMGCRGLLGLALSWSVLVHLSQYTFAAYIFQYPLWYFLPKALGEHWSAWLVILTLSWTVGAFMFIGVEEPCRKAVDRWLKRGA